MIIYFEPFLILDFNFLKQPHIRQFLFNFINIIIIEPEFKFPMLNSTGYDES
jgi:hypothetical protein